MSSPFIPCPFQYNDIPGGGQQAIINVQPVSPTPYQNQMTIGSFALNSVSGSLYYLSGFTLGQATWSLIGTSAGDIVAVAGTVNQISSSTTAGTATLSIPTTFVAPGSIASTTTLTAGTGFTSTSGNIVATNGNFVASTAGTGIVLNSQVASGTTTATLNGRSGQVTITTPSIAAGAAFTFTLTNSSVTASTTQVLYGLTGGATGAAITIQSVTNSASTSTIVLMNGSGVTASTLSLVLTFLVLN